MTCTCCQALPCCNGNACDSLTRSECASRGGSDEAGTCEVGACIDATGKTACTQANQCGCRNKPYASQHKPGFSCSCTELSVFGANGNGCRWYYCEQCVGGSCVNGCPSPRSCCAGTCCPLPQKCVNEACVDKCAAGTTFCAGNGTAFNCCGENTKCCGASGCLPSLVSANFTVNVAVNGWVSTGLTIPAGATVTITASGTVAWAGPGTTATPDGIPSGCRDHAGCDSGAGLLAVCHMRLIGRIDGVMFDVGSSYTGQPGAGLLELRQNDVCVGDNSGSYTGTASYAVDPCPGFTPAASGEPIVYGEGEEPPKLLPGPGAALKDILKLGGIVASPTCSCNARAAQMDAWGSGECIRRCREIVGWLKEESEKRNLWFFPPLGYALVFAAVALAALKRFWKSNNQ